MEADKKLLLSGEHQAIEKLADYLRTLKSSSWHYDATKSNSYASGIGEKAENAFSILFVTPSGRRVYIWMIRRGNTIDLTNITPVGAGQLSINEYNQIVDTLLVELKGNSGASFSVKASKDNITLDDIAGKEVVDAFNAWLKTCNPSTGNIHPYDTARWNQFVILCHKMNCDLDNEYLERFLKEKSKFYDDGLISSLIHDYEYGLELLSQNDGLR